MPNDQPEIYTLGGNIAPGNDRKLTLGRCCACEREGPEVRNIVCLEFRAPEPGLGCWGCFRCDLPQEGAIAVLRDECLAAGRTPTVACVGSAGANRRIPIGQLREKFEHDVSRHPEMILHRFRRNNAIKS
jgi:hypothetical protein